MWSSDWTLGDQRCEAGAAGALPDSREQLDVPGEINKGGWLFQISCKPQGVAATYSCTLR